MLVREVMDKRFIGKDPHMKEQQSNPGEADMRLAHVFHPAANRRKRSRGTSSLAKQD